MALMTNDISHFILTDKGNRKINEDACGVLIKESFYLLGYNVGDIYKRSNGIINVNLHKYDSMDDLVYNENITLRIKGKKVVLVVDNKKGKDIIQKSSQAGSYQAYGLLW